MSARNFHSVSMVAGIAATALGCYMVSLRVAGERATLEQVETRIVLAQRDIRSLQTEVGTRGRLSQLEKWNVKVLALSAPDANQFLQGSFQLATLARPHDKVVDPSAPVVLASAPRPQRVNLNDNSDSAPARPVGTPSEMLHVASFTAPERAAATAAKPDSNNRPESKKAVEKPVFKAPLVAPVVASASIRGATPAAKAIVVVSSNASAKLAVPATAKVSGKVVAKPVKAPAAPAPAAKDIKAKK